MGIERDIEERMGRQDFGVRLLIPDLFARRVGGAPPIITAAGATLPVLISATITMGTLMWLFCQLDSPGQAAIAAHRRPSSLTFP